MCIRDRAIALSNGTAEGQDNATYHLVANATYDDIKYFSFINYMWMGCTMAANADSWEKLPAEYQAILKDQAKIAAKYSFDTIAEDNQAATETLKAAGVEFDENPDIQSFKDKLGGNDYYLRYENAVSYTHLAAMSTMLASAIPALKKRSGNLSANVAVMVAWARSASSTTTF